MQTIDIINQSSYPKDYVKSILPALQEQVDRDFAPLWGISAILKETEVQIPGNWTIKLVDYCNSNGNLGFHLDENHIPIANVGVMDAAKYSVPVSTVISHELLEMLADPSTTRNVIIGKYYYIVEVCDPVTLSYYNIGDVKVSNFCTPRYFGYTNIGHFDKLGLLNNGIPDMLYGGMIMYYDGTKWISSFSRNNDGSLPWRAQYPGRNSWRANNTK